MRAIANECRRFGYRRLAILLRREAKGMNLKKVYRLYREERLTVRKRGGRKRALGTRAPMAVPQESNQRWSLDFVSDALACGRRFRVLNVIDDYSRECLACIVDTSLSGRRVVRELTHFTDPTGDGWTPEDIRKCATRSCRSYATPSKAPALISMSSTALPSRGTHGRTVRSNG